MTRGEFARLLVGAALLLKPAIGHPEDAVVRVPLADLRMAATADGRRTLKYLVSCALDEKAIVTATVEGTAYEFPGDLGLAPQWIKRPMTDVEQRWVSACMLARINLLGVTVQISMRAYFPSANRRLQVSEREAREFPTREATFFGNLFAEQPVSYVCGPPRTAARRRFLELRQRLCSLRGSAGGDPRVTQCGLVHVGACRLPAFTQQGDVFREAITVQLPAPRGPAPR